MFSNTASLEVLKYFLRLGCLGFGGPLAIISSIQKDLVIDKKWIPLEEFNGAFSLIKAMPGPVAFMTAVFMGRHKAGFIGAVFAAFGLVFPASVMMIFFSIFFTSISHYSFTAIILTGMQICALGVVLGSLKGLIKSNMHDFFFWFLIIFSGIINFYFPSFEPIVILTFGISLIIFKKIIAEKKLFELSSLWLVGWVCFKAGALVFGTGLAIVPMLKHDVVTKYNWLSNSEFMDALAFGQMTPGPVVITSTYIGHKVAGMPGAILATLGIFSASFFHMTTWFPKVVKKLSGALWIKDFVFGAIAAVVGPILVTVFKLFIGLSVTPISILFLLITFLVTLSGRIPLWLIIPGGGIIYFCLKLFTNSMNIFI